MWTPRAITTIFNSVTNYEKSFTKENILHKRKYDPSHDEMDNEMDDKMDNEMDNKILQKKQRIE